MSIENTPTPRIKEIVAAQHEYFRTGATLPVDFRLNMLQRLYDAMLKWEKPLCDALWQDLHKSYEEAYLTELSIVTGEIKNHMRHLKRWMRRSCKPTPIKLFPSRSRIVSEPLGTALIISPWNYPVQLLLNPLVGAISAVCNAVLKPSPYVPAVSKVIEDMIRDTFDEAYVAVVQGNRYANMALLEERYDIIFFTGSPSLGRNVMAAAAKNLTPVVLELGGKSPCIVNLDADIDRAAKRIAWGKTLNAGQTCIAPDYLLIHKDVKDKFIEAFAREMKNPHGEDARADKHFGRIVNDSAFDRISDYLKEGRILLGGTVNRAEKYIEPTLLEATPEMAVMQEEIFGPVLPVITFGDMEEVVTFVNRREKPLAFYYFGNEKTGWDIIGRTSSGGACINDTIMHIVNENVPFGGVGNSGMGRYHGKESFDAFSHYRSVIVTPTWIDLPFRYMPYKLFKLAKKII